MFNKLIYALILLAFTAAVPVSQAQTARKNRKKQTVQIQRDAKQDDKGNRPPTQNQHTTKQEQQEIRKWMKVDPRFAGPNAAEAKHLIDRIKNDFVEREFPRKMENFKAGSGSALLLQITANAYKKSLSHPDLEEATGIRLSWYNKVGAAFVALYHSLDEVERGIALGQEKRYRAAAIKYMELAKILEKILDKPEKIPSKELEKIKEANMLRRKREIQKKINELMRQRRTGR